jgi:hypothetical protein
MRATVTFEDVTLAASGPSLTYRVPAPTNGKRVSKLLAVTLTGATDATGAGGPAVNIVDRAGNRVGRWGGGTSAIGVLVTSSYTWSTAQAVLNQAIDPAVRSSPLPCCLPIEDGDVITVEWILTAGNIAVTGQTISFELEPM